MTVTAWQTKRSYSATNRLAVPNILATRLLHFRQQDTNEVFVRGEEASETFKGVAKPIYVTVQCGDILDDEIQKWQPFPNPYHSEHNYMVHWGILWQSKCRLYLLSYLYANAYPQLPILGVALLHRAVFHGHIDHLHLPAGHRRLPSSPKSQDISKLVEHGSL